MRPAPVLALLLPVLLAAGPALADLEAVPGRVRFEAGPLRAVAFRLDRPVASDTPCETSTSDPTVLEVERGVVFLAGERLAFAFVRPRAAGRALLTVRGPDAVAACAVEVAPDRTAPVATILTPAPGAVVWGTVRAAAAVFDDSGVSVEWFLDDESIGAGDGVAPAVDVPTRGRAGRRTLRLVAVDGSGNRTVDERTLLAVDAIGRGDLSVLEAEDLPAPVAIGNLNATPPAVQEAGGAFGGRVASLYSSEQIVQTIVEAAAAGTYQVVVRARGDHYLGYPSCAVFVDDQAAPVAAGPIRSADAFFRFGVGGPIRLEAGRHRLSIVFYNDLYDAATGLDRNCHVDRVEVLRVADEPIDLVDPTVCLVGPVDGDVVGGPLAVAAFGFDDDRVESLGLVVDGQEIRRVDGVRLVEILPGDALSPGPHTIEVVAVDAAGNRGRSHVARVRRLPYAGSAPELRYLPAAAGTSSDLEPTVDGMAPGGASWGLYGSGVEVVYEVDGLAGGDYEVELVARADLHEGAPIARVAAGEASVDIEVASPFFDVAGPAVLPLAPGRNRLRVEFVNDRYDGTPATDRNLHLATLVLRQVRPDRHPPVVGIEYPPAGAVVRGTEMIVATASDGAEIARVELLVDGRVESVRGVGGRVGLWLHAGRLEPGQVEIQVRAFDRWGNSALSPPRTLVVDRPGASLSATERARHLLDRLGLGASDREMAEVLLAGEAAWLDGQLGPAPVGGEPADALFVPLLRTNPYATDALRLLVLVRGLLTRRPVRERLTVFLDNHFSTWVGKSDAWREWFENALFHARATGSFRDHLALCLTSPAMITYLDNERNRRGAINENLAREILELHTLGVDGGYDQADVEATSRILTGWTTSLGFPWFEFGVSPAHHDRAAKTVLGVRFDSGNAYVEGPRLVALLAAHPSTARFVAGKLVALLVDDDRPADAVDRAADRFLATGGDLGEVVRSIVQGEAFGDRGRVGVKVKDPYELVVGVHRHPLAAVDGPALVRWTDQLGQPLFGCPTPDGYPEEGWLHSGVMVVRWNLAEDIAARLAIRAMVGGPAGRDRERLLDDLSATLLGAVLVGDERQRVLAALAGSDPADDAVARALAALLLQLPRHQRN